MHWVSGLQKSWHKNTKNVFVVEMHWKINKEVYEAAFSETANQKVLKTTGGVLSLHLPPSNKNRKDGWRTLLKKKLF